MAETSRPWSGTVIGDAGAYTFDNWTDVWERLLGALADADTGVLSNIDNELEVTGAATPMSVDTGIALVDGTYYQNTVAVSVAIATPAVDTRIDRVVLRKSWAAQTVRITLIAGVEGGGAPALTQNDGVTWDMPLFQASIATITGAITLTDERERLFTRHPSMTTAQRDAMTAADGMIIYNETTNTHEFRRNGAWIGGPIVQAVKADIEGETDEDTYIPPDLGRHGPWAAKAWAQIEQNGTQTLSYNLAGIGITGVGDRLFNYVKDFTTADYVFTGQVSGGINMDGHDCFGPALASYAVGSVQCVVRDHNGGSSTARDEAHCNQWFGTQEP